MALKLPEIMHFFQFCAGVSKKCSSVKAIYEYVYTPGSSQYTILENDMVYSIPIYSSLDIPN